MPPPFTATAVASLIDDDNNVMQMHKQKRKNIEAPGIG